MVDEFYLKDVCDIYPMLKSPVLFIMLGERGKEAFPFLEKTRGGMGDSIQMLQIASPEYKVQDPNVEYININASDWEENISWALENTIIPILKASSYTMKGMISVNVLVDVDDQESFKLEELSKHIYGHLISSFENSVDFYFYCFAAVKFKRDKSFVVKSKVMDTIKELYVSNDWVRLAYVVSDLNEDDVYLSNNLEKKYLALTLNTFLQAGYHINPDDSIFDSVLFAEKNNPGRNVVFQAIGCAPLTLNTELLETYFKWQLVQYYIDRKLDDFSILKNIFPSLGAEKHIVTESFEKNFPNYYENAEYIAYNRSAFHNSSRKCSNRALLRRLYNNSHQEYYEQNVLSIFEDKFKVELGDNGRSLEGQFLKAIREGHVNLFNLMDYEKKRSELESEIRRIEDEKRRLEREFQLWEDSSITIVRFPLFKTGRFSRIRRKKIQEWLDYKKKILIQDSIIRYLHMERDCVLKMLEISAECRKVAENYLNASKSNFSRLERSAFTYQTDNFKEYYSLKVKETMEHSITEQEKQKLYICLCRYMLDEKNCFSVFETGMKDFLKVFWRQGTIKENLVEEILDRMKVMKQKNAHDVLIQLYRSTIDAKNVNLRVIKSGTGNENDVCCFLGPSDNEFISFLRRYKEKDSHVRVLVVEQLTAPVVLYFKFNISENEIRI